jgi:hypothetical protein
MPRRAMEDERFEVVIEREEAQAPPPEPLPLALQRGAGNQAVVRMLSRVKEKKGEGGIKVKYAESEAEAERLCREEAARHELDWDKHVSKNAKETILRYAQMFQDERGENAGLPMAYQLISTEATERRKAEARKKRKDEMDDEDSEYNQLRSRIEGDDILEAAIDWMKDDYVAGQGGKINHTLGVKYTREEVRTAVRDWRGESQWVAANCKVIKGPHGYEVGPKNEQVGDTLDRRGDQGNIIATWAGSKINIHVNPSD